MNYLSDLEQLKEHEIKKFLLRLSLALDAGNIGVWDWDLVTNVTTWDEKMFEMYGIMKTIPMPYENWINSVFPEDRPIAEASLQRTISSKEANEVIFRIVRPDGDIRYIKAAADALCDESGEVINVIGLNIDITEEIEIKAQLSKSNRKLEALVHIDGLTGIANRRAYEKRIKIEIANSKRSGSPLSLLMIDIDYFKQYNDSYGHVKGDTALRTIAQCLSKSIERETDLVARYGGEEFVVLLGHTPLQDAERIAKKIKTDIQNEKIEHSFSSVSSLLTVSIGISSTEISCNDLVEHSDEALYTAKKNGRNRYEIYANK